MNRNKKILNVTMAAGMAAVLGTTPVIAAAQEADNGVSKEETVYVNATAEGEIKDITVSDWLKNSGSAEGDISDVSDLEGIKNVKGDETFTQDGDKVTWNTDSSDRRRWNWSCIINTAASSRFGDCCGIKDFIILYLLYMSGFFAWHVICLLPGFPLLENAVRTFPGRRG